jgi:CDP-4-dehydro-6-deoxyglucose reductase
VPQVTLQNGRRYTAEPGTTLLDAALAQGLTLEHSCRNGRCGSCKARVLEGQVSALRDAASLTVQEAQDGWVLTCAHEALTDVTLDLEDLGALAGISIKTLPSRIASLTRLAPDVLKLELRLPPTAHFRFLPGQSVDVTSPGGVRRSYSLSGDAADTSKLELQIRRVEGGQFSAYWFEQAQVNDLLRFQGPRGTFFLRPVAGRNLVFLATGTGIAPFASMLRQLAVMAPAERPASVSLYWGGRHEADLYFDPAPLLTGLRYVPVLSRAQGGWQGARGHVQDAFLRDRESMPCSLAQAAVYACGSEAMIHSARQQLLAAGLPAKQYFYDAFVSSN